MKPLHRKNNNFAKFEALTFTLIFLVGVLGQTSTPPSTSQTPSLGIVERKDIIQKVTTAGTISPNKKSAISAPYAGYVKKIYVKVGQKISANEPVVSVSQTLRGPGGDSYPLRSPFNGVVVQVLRTEGEYVDPTKDQMALVRIDDISRFYVISDVPESEIGKVKVGQEAIVKTTSRDSKTYKGVVREIFLAARDKNQNSRWGEHVDFTTKIEITDPDDAIKSGMSTLVDIITNKSFHALALSTEFVQLKDDKYFVTLSDGKLTEVTVGLQTDDLVEIKNGLKEGDKVKMVDYFSLGDSVDSH